MSLLYRPSLYFKRLRFAVLLDSATVFNQYSQK